MFYLHMMACTAFRHPAWPNVLSFLTAQVSTAAPLVAKPLAELPFRTYTAASSSLMPAAHYVLSTAFVCSSLQ